MHYSHSSLQDTEFDVIENDSTVSITGIGNVILGSIGDNTVITKSGVGTLRIKGPISENVFFNISGVGNVEFDNRPPQHVINNIKKSGPGKILIVPDNSFAKPTTSDFKMFAEKKQEDVISLVLEKDKIYFTRNNITHVYNGKCAFVKKGDLYIDGERVTNDDPRLLSSSIGNGRDIKPRSKL